MIKEVDYTLNSEEVLYLCKVDEQLRQVISVIGVVRIKQNNNFYEALLKSIIGQQLSIAAASTIWLRVTNLFEEVNPQCINNIPDEKFQSAGVSRQKITYIRDLNNKILSKELVLDSLAELSDQEVVTYLSKVKGIGNWTAEMFLIFSLGRLNTLSYGDAGIKRAIRWLYQEEASEIMPELYKKWSPYNSIASFYLWEIINRGIITRYKNIEELYI